MSQYIPLYQFFQTLRGHKDFSLGLAEYFSLIEVFQKDRKYQKDAQQLLNLCRFLWLKPGQSENLFVSLFRQSFDWREETENEEEDENEELSESDSTENEDQTENEDKENDTDEADENSDLEEESANDLESEDLYLNIINKNVGKSVKTTTEEKLVEPYKIHLLDKHVVLKERQLKQRWRALKKIIEGKLGNEIDIDRTIVKIGQTGFLIEPSFQREKINAASLITLVDNQGSMVAFKLSLIHI